MHKNLDKIFKYAMGKCINRSVLSGDYKCYRRYTAIENIQSKCLISKADILQCIQEANNRNCSKNKKVIDDLRLLSIPSKIKVVAFKRNCSYGFRKINKNLPFLIINPLGFKTLGLSHFCYSLYDNTYFGDTKKIITISWLVK